MTTRSLRSLLVPVLVASALALSGCAAEQAFRSGEREAQKAHWDLAVMAFEKAAALDPDNGKYRIALSRTKLRAALVHVSRGRLHRAAGQLDLAQVEFEQAVALDPTNDSAQEELRRITADIETRRLEVAGGVTPTEQAKAKARGAKVKPPMLVPSSDKPIDVTFPPDSSIKKIYQSLCAAAGINVIYDPQLKDDKFSLDLKGMTFQKALETAMRQAGHFYKVIDERTILVAQDTQQNRKEYEDLVIRTFFLSNGDVKDVSAMVRSILDLRRMGTIPQLNAIVIRDTADKVAVAEKLIEVNDKAKAEVVVDVELLQLLTRRLLDLGAQLSSYSTTITPILPSSSSSSSSTSTSNTVLWSDLIKNGITDFSLTVPSVTVNFIKQNSDAELLARPQLRIAEGEKATLVIGNRVPIPVTTINTQQAVGSVGVVPITSFQYQDVGIKLDIEARVHHNKEVSLKLTVEVSNLNGSVSGSNGQSQPIIATRTITSNIRLKEGETSFLAGLFQNYESTSKNGIPFLSDIPLVGPLFTQTRKENERTDIFLTLTPHITRAPKITEEDLVPIWVGTENNVSFSGLNTRLESPGAAGSPFDSPMEVPGRPRPVAPSQPVPGTQQPVPQTPSQALPGVIQGSGPNDPFKRDTKPQSSVTPKSAAPVAASGSLAVSSVETGGSREVALAFEADATTLSPGDVTVVSLTASSALKDVGSLELTVEWDPSVVEVTGIAPGPWRSGTDALNVRFEADRAPGRARLMFGTPTGVVGLPDGVLSRLLVRAAAPGSAAFRLSAGAGLGKSGPVRLAAEGVVLKVGG